jgi:signal transduction histidine kinase
MNTDRPDLSGTPPIEEAVGEDRRQTDETLRTERLETDELLETERAAAAQKVVAERRDGADRRLQDVRDEVDSHRQVQASILPLLSEKLEEVSATLAREADSSNGFTVAPAELIGRLAEIAGNMAEVTSDLESERQAADRKLAAEREITDQIIEQQSQAYDAQTESDAAAGRAEQSILDDERQATDQDLARERQHTDDAIENVVHAFEEERHAHVEIRDEYATRTEFLAIVSHDLRGPLSAAMAAAALIKLAAAENGDPRRIGGWADQITRSLATMDRLIRDLLDFASFEDGKLKVVPVEQDVNGLMVHAVETFGPLAAAKAVSLTADLPPHVVAAPFDRARILQVVSNLLQNAIKFTPKGGAIRVQVTEAPGECTVRVVDSGIGIPETELTSIFDRFKQLDTARDGLGLGLYIAKWIVEAHHGRIWAEPGRESGAALSFALPRVMTK